MLSLVILSLIFVPVFNAVQPGYKVPLYKPVFSRKRDAIRLIGGRFSVNCSVKEKQRFIPIATLEHYNQYAFDLNKLKILHCSTEKYSSCVVVNNTMQIDNRTIKLFKKNLSIEDAGTYFCQYNGDREDEDNISLKIGYKPIGPENILCVSIDLNNLSCTWKPSKRDRNNPLRVHYQSFFNARPTYGEFDCPHPSPLNKKELKRNDIGCELYSASTGDNKSFDENSSYNLSINASNVRDSHIVTFPVIKESIVKLSRPVIVSVTVYGRRIDLVMDLELNSQIALTWLETILYQISFTPDTPQFQEHTINFTSTQNSGISASLFNLIPYTNYAIEIRMKGLASMYWSEKVVLRERTKATVPVAVPDIVGYQCKNFSCAVYVKPIQKWEKNSENAYYIVTVMNHSGVIHTQNVSWDKTTVENIDCLMHNSSYQVKMRTFNDVGQSDSTRSIHIPIYQRNKETPRSIVVEGSETKYVVSWGKRKSNMEDLDTIVVYYCRGTFKVCDGDLNWANITRYQTSTHIDTAFIGKWIFAVAFIYTDGYNTGLVFSECYFPSFIESPVDVAKFSAVPLSESEIQVKTGDYCSTKYPSKPIEYTVYYKQSNGNVRSCDSSFEKQKITASIETDDMILRNLKPSTNYAICLRIVTKGGSKSSEPKIVRTFDPFERSDKGYIAVIAVIGSVLMVVVCIFTTLKLRKKYTDMNNDIERIDMPKISKPKHDKITNNTQMTNVGFDSGVVSWERFSPEINIQNEQEQTVSNNQEDHVTNDFADSGHFDNEEIVGTGEILQETLPLLSHNSLRNVKIKEDETIDYGGKVTLIPQGEGLAVKKSVKFEIKQTAKEDKDKDNDISRTIPTDAEEISTYVEADEKASLNSFEVKNYIQQMSNESSSGIGTSTESENSEENLSNIGLDDNSKARFKDSSRNREKNPKKIFSILSSHKKSGSTSAYVILGKDGILSYDDLIDGKYQAYNSEDISSYVEAENKCPLIPIDTRTNSTHMSNQTPNSINENSKENTPTVCVDENGIVKFNNSNNTHEKCEMEDKDGFVKAKGVFDKLKIHKESVEFEIKTNAEDDKDLTRQLPSDNFEDINTSAEEENKNILSSVDTCTNYRQLSNKSFSGTETPNFIIENSKENLPYVCVDGKGIVIFNNFESNLEKCKEDIPKRNVSNLCSRNENSVYTPCSSYVIVDNDGSVTDQRLVDKLKYQKESVKFENKENAKDDNRYTTKFSEDFNTSVEAENEGSLTSLDKCSNYRQLNNASYTNIVTVNSKENVPCVGNDENGIVRYNDSYCTPEKLTEKNPKRNLSNPHSHKHNSGSTSVYVLVDKDGIISPSVASNKNNMCVGDSDSRKNIEVGCCDIKISPKRSIDGTVNSVDFAANSFDEDCDNNSLTAIPKTSKEITSYVGVYKKDAKNENSDQRSANMEINNNLNLSMKDR